MNTAAQEINELVDVEANLIFGAVVDDSMSGQVGSLFLFCQLVFQGLLVQFFSHCFVIDRLALLSLQLDSKPLKKRSDYYLFMLKLELLVTC